MGTCYVVIFHDDFDWEYVGRTKEDALVYFKEKYPVAKLVGDWYGYMVFDINKVSPYNEENNKYFKSFADKCWIINEYSPYKLEPLEEYDVKSNVT